MTEPPAARTRPGSYAGVRDGDHYVVNGEKWFSSNARFAEFLA